MTKKAFRRSCWLILVCSTIVGRALGHEIPVHMRISISAAQRCGGLSNFVDRVLSPEQEASLQDSDDPNATAKSPVDWIEYGSAREDDSNAAGVDGGYRSCNHFYDPITRKGLSDKPVLPAEPLGQNSFVWASLFRSPGVISSIQRGTTKNEWSWPNARDYEYRGLTSESASDRDRYLAKMFRSLGQVIHLLQDTTQPQHVRNEQHLDKYPFIRWETPWNSAIERYGKKNINTLIFSPDPPALDWKTAGFSKMEDFWDRHLYVVGQDAFSQVLIANESQAIPILGLAEYSNGNFLGVRHRYREEMTFGNLGYYPFPTREATDWALIKASPADYKKIGTIPRQNFGSINRFSIKKTGNGKIVENHSATHYLAARGRNMPGVAPFLTIDDPDVLREYHNILIPKAVQYSAGLLDYFFRGRFDVFLGPGSSTEKSGLRIVNKSGQKLQGGTFQFFYDDEDGVRAEIASPDFTTTYTDTLADGDTITAEFIKPAVPVSAYVLLYKGTLVKDGTAVDPVDRDIAIIARRITCQEGPGDDIEASVWDDFWVPDGTVTAVLEGGTPPTRVAGYYRHTYLSGYNYAFSRHFCNITMDHQCANCTGIWFDTLTSWQIGVGEYEARCPDPNCGWDNSPQTAVASRVEANTPRVTDKITHYGGPLGPTAHEPASCSGLLPTQEGGTFTPGTTYALERQHFRHVAESAGIVSLKIRDFTALTPNLLPCPTCTTDSLLPVWNGEIPMVEPSPSFSAYLVWQTTDEFTDELLVSINGFSVAVYIKTAYDLPTPEHSGWRISIECESANYSRHTIWYGYKSKGYSPKGTYLLDPNYPGCADSEIQCITLE